MANKLSLQVILDTVDRATRPLKKITQGSGKTAEALKASRDQLRHLERAQKDLRGFRNLKRQAETSSRALEQQQQEIRDLSRQLKNAEGDTSALTRKRDEAIRQARRLSQQYESEQRQLQQLRTNMTRVDGVTGKFSDQQRELQRRIQQANQEMQQQQRHLGEIARKQRLAADASRQFHRGMGRAGRMQGAGAGGLATGGAALYAGARMLAPGIDYGAQMSAVQAVGRFEKNDPRFQALRAQSRELGASTAFSATEVGAGQEFLLRAGMSSKAITTSMRDVLDLAIANNTELGRTADIASNIAGTFKIDLEQDGSMTRVADVLSATASRANVDLEMLGNTVKYLGGAEDLNLTLEQATTMAGVLGNIGIQGEMAGTAMRAMTSRLTKPTSAAAAVMQDLGVQVADAQGNMRDIPEILQDINAATAGLGNVERKAALQEIFGVEAGSGMAELVSSMGSGQLTELLEQIQNARGENARMAATRADNIDGDLKSLRSAWEEVGITITETNEGPLRGLVQMVTEVVRSIGIWMNENPELTGQIAIAAGGVAALVAAGGALTLALGSLLGPLVLTRYGLQMIGIKGAGAGKLLGKLGKATKWLGKMLGGTLLNVLKGLTRALGMAGRAILSTSRLLLVSLIRALSATGRAVLTFSRVLLVNMVKALMVVGRAILFVSRALLMNPIGLLITAIAGGAWLIWKYWDKLAPWFTGLWERIKSGGRAVWEWMKDKGAQAADFISYVFFNWTLPGLLIQHWDTIKAKASELWEWFKSIPGKAASFVANAFMNWTLPGLLITHWDEVKAKASELWQWFQDAPSNAIDAIAQMIEDWNLKDMLKEKWDAAIDYLKGLPGQMREAGADLAQGVADGISSGASQAREAIGDTADDVVGWFRNKMGIHSPSRVFAELGVHTMEGYQQGIQRSERGPLNEVATFAKRITQAGAGIALGTLGTTAATAGVLDTATIADVPIDHRPPLSSVGIGNVTITVGDINVHPAPGMDEQALARYVAAEVQRALKRAAREQSARRRSAFHDTE